ncbi:GumC family protein [Edaphobacter flagellatus]|uniref:GumC family protein n=1 Tax=Edaphobacter flagellatus TaxID=1933044 RepID=UPI0021B186A5|nr:GNVR domain-containing protein [Edaphobacter flagellatus]
MLQEPVLSHLDSPTSGESAFKTQQPGLEEPPKIDPLKLSLILLQGKKTILRFALVTIVLTAGLVFFVLKPTYTAEAVFLPPQNSPGSSMAQIASQLGSLGAIGALGGLKSPGDLYIGILGSHTIADTLVKRFNLQEVYKAKRLSDAERVLRSNSKFVSGKDTLITVLVEDHDPKRASDIANGYLDALYEQNGRLALTEAAQRRAFFEEQLQHEKNALADAEVQLKITQEQTGLISPVGQAQAEIQAIAELRAQITSREVALGSLKQAATSQNPEVVRLQTEISGLQNQLQKLQNDNQKFQPGDIQRPTAKIPQLALEYVRRQREVKYHEVLFELIAKQYEAARLDESRESPLLQIVDRARIPDRKSGPPRMLLLLAGAFFGIALGVIYVLLRHAFRTMQQDPVMAEQLKALRQAAL